MRSAVARDLKAFSAEVARGLGIPKTSARIIEVLALTGRRLSFCELAGRVRVSKRSLRTHLRVLLNRGILLRKVAVTPTRRLGYEYYIAPLGQILELVRRELSMKIQRLQRLSAELKGGRKLADG